MIWDRDRWNAGPGDADEPSGMAFSKYDAHKKNKNNAFDMNLMK